MVKQPFGVECVIYCIHGVNNMLKKVFFLYMYRIYIDIRSGAFNGAKSVPTL